ncbi:MAG: hypothetical protein GY711_18430 [bacterium]|nr:hypothetical protein [bacterium]
MRLSALRLFIAFFVPATPALGQVPTGPFSGQLRESFETQVPAGYTACLPGRLFGQAADLCTPGGANLLLTPAWNFNCNMLPYAGGMFVGARQGDWLRLTFDEPVSRFGGHFGSNGGDGDVTVRFFDAAGHLIGRATPDVPTSCGWAWHGWESAGAPFATIEIENSLHAGGLVMLDDLEVDLAGDPGTSFCSTNANSSGLTAAILASGSESLTAGDLVLHASGLPAGTTGLFFYAPLRTQVPFGNGVRCVAGGPRQVARLTPLVASGAGAFQQALDYAAPPNPETTIQAGSTWSFQAWFLDPAGGGAGFSTSDAVEIQFVP